MLLDTAQRDADARWQLYEQIAGVRRVIADGGRPPPVAGGAGAGAATAAKPDGAPQAPLAKEVTS
jgi:hypothetical protein